jgi:uncharacterized protein involved in exopolysaccharide biosynthesis
MQGKTSNYNFTFLDTLKFIIKWRKHLLIVTLSAGVLGYLITLLIKPEYKSKAVFYPGTVNSISYALFYSIKERAQDVLAYGNEQYVEQYLQLAKSSKLREKIAADFKLMEHYGIDVNDPKKDNKLNKKLDKYIRVNRTSYNSVEVLVYDTDPKMAADIANAVMYGTDSLKKQSQRAIAEQALAIVKEEYDLKVAVVDSLTTMFKRLGDAGVYNVEEQAKALSELIGRGGSNAFIEKEGQKLGQYVGDFVSLDEQIRFEAEQLTELRKKYSQAKIDFDSKLGNIFVVDIAQPDYHKAYPLRLVTAILSAVAGLIMASVTIIVLERFKNIKSELTAE